MKWPGRQGIAATIPKWHPCECHIEYSFYFVQLWSTICTAMVNNQFNISIQSSVLKLCQEQFHWMKMITDNMILHLQLHITFTEKSHSETTVKCKAHRCNIMLMGPLLFSVLLLIKRRLHMQSWICCWLFKLGMKMRHRFLYIWMGKQCLLFEN